VCKAPFTHRLTELADLLQDVGVEWPIQFEPLLDLTPFAVELRYAVLPKDQPAVPLDRVMLVSLVEMLRQYVAEAIGHSP
jgi:hypothetical protein